MENPITVEQAIEMTAELLEKISIPMKHINDIGMPVAEAINNLRQCLTAIENARQADENAAQDGGGDAIELVPEPVEGENG